MDETLEGDKKMETFAERIKEKANELQDELFDLACKIFDRPEIGGEETFATDLLCEYLERCGFLVERGVAGLPTAFRATYERGEGGPTIGFCMEFDALPHIGHACGHHLQSPACIGAALILKELWDQPLRIVLYGTPDEEGLGGKVAMVENGCFTEADVMFCYHTGSFTFLSDGNRALAPFEVTFHGTAAHASGAPQNGRSALDAMMLAFHGLEIMREHVKDGCRIHYTISNGTGPVNVVHEEARCRITLRSFDRNYLAEMKSRMEKVIEGACLMTETRGEIKALPEYWNYVSLDSFREPLLRAAKLSDAKNILRERRKSGGSSDIGNVSWVCPTAYFYTFYSDAKGHSSDYLIEGKAEAAKNSMMQAAMIFSLTALELMRHPEKIQLLKEEFQAKTKNK